MLLVGGEGGQESVEVALLLRLERTVGGGEGMEEIWWDQPVRRKLVRRSADQFMRVQRSEGRGCHM